MQLRVLWVFSGIVGALLFAGCSTSSKNVAATSTNSWPCYNLSAEKVWQLDSPNKVRFDASGLLLQKGKLLTVNDRGSERYEIKFANDVANLVLLTNFFTETQLAGFAKEKVGRYDCEGIAQDGQGRIYLCEEANRWILRFDPKTKKVERLPIDWSSVEKYFHPKDRNASFEGIAIGDGKLFLANERQEGRIIVLDLKTLEILDDFTVCPTKTKMKDIHYSDLSWFDGALFAILRENRVIVKIDPKRHSILAEYDFHEMEQAPELAYKVAYPTSTMEGLAVDKNYFWLVTDNNGWGRKKFPDDARPTLFKCRRPDK
ncbi:MAG: esterase-like activity of phytase family protein [Verrucomicrobiota bacterium]